MSQIYVPTTSSSNLPPDVPTSFTTDDGVAVPAANNINIIARDTDEDNPNGIQTEGSGSTVAIELTNRVHATGVLCPPNENTQILSFNLGPDTAAYRISCNLVGRQLNGTISTIGYTIAGTFKTNGLLATKVDSVWKHSDEDIPKTDTYITLDVDGANAVELVLHNDTVGTEDMIISALLEYIVV